MAWVNTGTHRTFSGAAAPTLADAGTISVSVGDFVVVGFICVRGGGPQPTLHVSDNLSNTWDNSTDAVAYTGDTAGIAAVIRWSTITTGGSMAITLDGNGSNSFDVTAFMRVFQNPNVAPISSTNVTNSGTVSPMDTTGITPVNNDVLMIALASCGGSSRTITENNATGDTDWTLSDEQQSGTNCAGSMVFKIIAGAPGTYRAAWTLNSAASWATTIRALKPAVSSSSAMEWSQPISQPTDHYRTEITNY